MTDPWETLKRFTAARIAQGRAGHGLRTESHLDFQLAHAAARDAVHLPWDVEGFAGEVAALGLDPMVLATPVTDRMQYLKRPDLGRMLDKASGEHLATWSGARPDLALVFTNGLSSTAMDAHGLNLLRAIIEAFDTVSIGPICLVPNGRVALSDEIGAALGARLAVIVVGERPGLSSADSLGIYMTYNPNPANTDAERNCISNVRPPEGLDCRAAAVKLRWLADQALLRQLSGVELKDDMPAGISLAADESSRSLLP
jgi:ethanolamine ammonia-lyase small subunit